MGVTVDRLRLVWMEMEADTCMYCRLIISLSAFTGQRGCRDAHSWRAEMPSISMFTLTDPSQGSTAYQQRERGENTPDE